VLSHVLGAVDKTSSSFSAHGKIGNFIIIIIIIMIIMHIISNRKMIDSYAITVIVNTNAKSYK